MDKISKLEKGEALTVYEDWAIKKLMGAWATDNGLTFETTKKSYTVKEDGDTQEGTEAIEYPISEFFETVKQDKLLSITDFQQFIYIYKALIYLIVLINYTYNFNNINYLFIKLLINHLFFY